ncbi:MAG: AAA family ATPase [Candidatus Dojkabacteria bacterium]|nr:AAA family ATPase [Candidatus Dojkabacteria bacterium]
MIYIPWNEKYRPKNFDDLILSPDIKEKMEEYVQQKNIPNLLFVGDPGIGKTTCAKILAKEITQDILFLNSSEKRGIDILRNQISDFCSTISLQNNIKIVILDEFDNMTFDAMSALRGAMEEFIDNSRFILTGNFEHRIIDAIVSRCQTFYFKNPDKKEIFKFCLKILKNEDISYDKELIQNDLKYIINHYYPDIRSIIGCLEKNTKNKIFSLKNKVLEDQFIDVKELMIKYIKERNWRNIRKQVCKAENYETLLRYIFDKAEEISPEKCEIIMLLAAEGLKYHPMAIDPEINFMATILKIIQEL